MSVCFSRHLVQNAQVDLDRELRPANDEAGKANEEMNQHCAVKNI